MIALAATEVLQLLAVDAAMKAGDVFSTVSSRTITRARSGWSSVEVWGGGRGWGGIDGRSLFVFQRATLLLCRIRGRRR